MGKLAKLRITITGGAKSGKTTIMKAIGKSLGIYCLSTGDLFRCHAWIWSNSKLDILDVDGRIKELKKAYIHLGNNYNYYYKKIRITDEIDTYEMSSTTCQLAQIPWFRKIVKDKIAKIIRKHNQLVVEGRDTGTKILPDAEIKVFLNHDYDSRVANIKGTGDDKAVLKNLLIWRDKQDQERSLDPFVKPEGAFTFDNSYIKKVTASQLLLQRIILPELTRLGIKTKYFNPSNKEENIVLSNRKNKVDKKQNKTKKYIPSIPTAPEPKKSIASNVNKTNTKTNGSKPKVVMPSEKDVLKMLEKSEFSAPTPPVYRPVLAANNKGSKK